ncbi:MAG: endonuclease NucS [Candidatus Caldarchaeum sp.]|nr:endonuclease NucS [Candidatus Caldarchaeum sp.]
MTWMDRARKGLTNGSVIVLAGRCVVHYEGRAASKLGEGERLVIIKKDRSILVHRPTGHEPVNWQPKGSKIEFVDENGLKVVKASKGGEFLKIVFTSEPEVSVFGLSDEAEFEMHASELEMKQAVLLEPNLLEEGFKPFAEERRAGRTGRVDVFGIDKDGVLTVVELKRKPANEEDVRQLQRYADELEREFGKRPRTILAAPSTTRTAASTLKSAKIEFKCLTPRTCMEVLRRKRGLDAHL